MAMRPLTTAMRWLVLVLAVGYCLVFVWAALARMDYPYQVEIMEAELLRQVERMNASLPIYQAPTLEYSPMVYSPLFYYVTSLLSGALGSNLAVMRFVSLLATLGTLVLLYAIVRRETGRPFWGCVAAGVYAGTYRAVSFWFDVARPDSLAILFALLGVYLLRFHRGLLSAIAAGALLALAFLTKQTALMWALPVLGFVLLQKRREGLAAIASFAALGGTATWALNRASDGWYWFYCFVVPSTVFSSHQNVVLFWTRDVLPVMTIAVLLTLALAWRIRGEMTSSPLVFWFVCALGFGGSSWLYSLNWGAAANGLMPLFAMLAILMAMSCANLAPEAESGTWSPLLYGAVAMQLFVLVYNPAHAVPPAAAVADLDRMVVRITQAEGPVFIPYHPYLAERAGKPWVAHWMNLRFLLPAGARPEVTAMATSLRRALQTGRFAAVITDGDWGGENITSDVREDLNAAYSKEQAFAYSTPASARMTSGIFVRPEFFYIKKPGVPSARLRDP